MATIKSYSDLEQSKKLAGILPIESSDGYWDFQIDGYNLIADKLGYYKNDSEIPCWSLASLLGVLPNNKHITTTLSRGGWKIEPVEYIDKWFCEYEDEVDNDSPCRGFTVSADNPVDACVTMIEKLHKLSLL